jgi:hypothetical protein
MFVYHTNFQRDSEIHVHTGPDGFGHLIVPTTPPTILPLGCRGDNLFTNFIAYLSSPGPDEAARRGGYLKQNLEEIKNALKLSGNPFLGGQNPKARDFQLAPQLYHIKVASKAIQVKPGFKRS